MTESGSNTSISATPIEYGVTVRIATLNMEEDRFGGDNPGRNWNTQINREFQEANRIFNRYGIAIRQGVRLDVPVVTSRAVLGIQEMAVTGRMRERYMGRGRLNRRRGTQLTQEEGSLLRINRGTSSEVCVYWVPSIDSAFGITYHNVAYRMVRNNEGIVIGRGVQVDTFAHELGHLLMRCTHVDFEAPFGEERTYPEDVDSGHVYNVPPTNLMYPYNDARQEPRELNQTQLSILRRSQYLVRSSG